MTALQNGWMKMCYDRFIAHQLTGGIIYVTIAEKSVCNI